MHTFHTFDVLLYLFTLKVSSKPPTDDWACQQARSDAMPELTVCGVLCLIQQNLQCNMQCIVAIVFSAMQSA